MRAGGTGSSPLRANGLQRSSLHSARKKPRTGPWVAMAMEAYSEHVADSGSGYRD